MVHLLMYANEFTGEGITGFTEWVDDYRHCEYNAMWKWRRGYMNDFIVEEPTK